MISFPGPILHHEEVRQNAIEGIIARRRTIQFRGERDMSLEEAACYLDSEPCQEEISLFQAVHFHKNFTPEEIPGKIKAKRLALGIISYRALVSN